MFPVLLAIGPVVIKTVNLAFVLALLAGLFVFWRKGREEHYEEAMLFDGLLLSLLFGLVLARAAFIAMRFGEFGLNVMNWLDLVNKPGFSISALFIGSAFFLYRYAKKKKWDEFEILDFWVMGVTLAQVFIWFGYFLAGTALGTETNLPWGMVFPSVFTKHHPTQLYYALFFSALFWYLSWAEVRYRTFVWYRFGKNTAQTGYLLSVCMLLTGLFSLVMGLVTVPEVVVAGVRADSIFSLVLTVFGLSMLYSRSGRSFPWRRKQQSKLEQFTAIIAEQHPS